MITYLKKRMSKVRTHVYRCTHAFFPLYHKEIMLGIIIITLLSIFCLLNQEKPQRIYQLERPNFMEGNKNTTLYYTLEGDDSEQSIRFSLGEGELDEEKVMDYLEYSSLQLSKYILAQHHDFKVIEGPIVLPETFRKCHVVYHISPYDLIDSEGWYIWEKIEKTTRINIECVLTLNNVNHKVSLAIDVSPDAFSKNYFEVYTKNRLDREWRILSNNKYDSMLQLPDDVEFYDSARLISWKQILLIIFVIVLFCMVLSRAEKRIQEIKLSQFKRIQLMYLITSFLLLFESGMTIRKSMNYALINRVQSIEDTSPLISVLKELINQLMQGVDLAIVMQCFNNVFSFTEGRRFSRLLLQNMKQGDHLLSEQVRQLSEDMWDERIRHARKESEKASSKLVLPMLLIFIVILLITIVPTLIEVKNFI